jgi:putative tricarboxylic transport membrane protein
VEVEVAFFGGNLSAVATTDVIGGDLMSDGTSSGEWARSAQARRSYNIKGGAVLALAGAVLFATSFLLQNPVPLTLHASIIIFIAVGIAISAGFFPVQNPQNVYGGMALILLALTAFVASNDLPGMRGFAFGPGTAPRLFAFTLAVLSLGVVINGLLTSGPDVTGYRFRSVIFIIGSILAFAAAIRPLGLVVASFCCMIICAAASDDVKWRETVLVAAVVTAFCSVLFPYGLNLPFQLWPRFW